MYSEISGPFRLEIVPLGDGYIWRWVARHHERASKIALVFKVSDARFENHTDALTEAYAWFQGLVLRIAYTNHTRVQALIKEGSYPIRIKGAE